MEVFLADNDRAMIVGIAILEPSSKEETCAIVNISLELPNFTF